MLPSLSTLFKLGAGVRSLNEKVLSNTPLLLEQIEVTESTPLVNMQIVGIQEQKSLHSALGISLNASGSAPVPSPAGEIDLSANAKANFSKQITVDNQHIYFVIKKKVTTNESFTNNIIISNSVGQLLLGENGVENFYALYGDKFVSQISSGSEIIVVIKIDSNVLGRSSNVGSETSLNVTALTTKIQTAMSTQSTKDSFSGVTNAGCWVYIDGIPGTESFTLDTTNLGETLQSVKDLMGRIDTKQSAALLSCKLSSYSVAQLSATDSAVKSTQVASRIKQSDVTHSLFQLDAVIRTKKGFFDDLNDARQTGYEYFRKYEQLSEIMKKEPTKYGSSLPIEENRENIVAFEKLQVSTKKVFENLVEKRASASVSAIATITAEQGKEKAERDYSTSVATRKTLAIQLEEKKSENEAITQQKTNLTSEKTSLETQKNEIDTAIKKAEKVARDLRITKIPVLENNFQIEEEKQTRINQEVAAAQLSVDQKSRSLRDQKMVAIARKNAFELAERNLAVAKNNAEREDIIDTGRELSERMLNLDLSRRTLVRTSTADQVIPGPVKTHPHQTGNSAITRQEVQYSLDASVLSLRQEELSARIDTFNESMPRAPIFEAEQNAFNAANAALIRANMALSDTNKDLDVAREKLEKLQKKQIEIDAIVAEKHDFLQSQRALSVNAAADIRREREKLLQPVNIAEQLRHLTNQLTVLEEQAKAGKIAEKSLVDSIASCQEQEKSLLKQIPAFQKVIDQNQIEQAAYQAAINALEEVTTSVVGLCGAQIVDKSKLSDALKSRDKKKNNLNNVIKQVLTKIQESLDERSDIEAVMTSFSEALPTIPTLNITNICNNLRNALQHDAIDIQRVLTQFEILLIPNENNAIILRRLRMLLNTSENASNINAIKILSVVQHFLNTRTDKNSILRQAQNALKGLDAELNLDNVVEIINALLVEQLGIDAIKNGIRAQLVASESQLNKVRVRNAVKELLGSSEAFNIVKVKDELRTILMAEGRLNIKAVLSVFEEPLPVPAAAPAPEEAPALPDSAAVVLAVAAPDNAQQRVLIAKQELLASERELRVALDHEFVESLENAIAPGGQFARSHFYCMKLKEINQKLIEIIESIALEPSKDQAYERQLQAFKNRIHDAIRDYSVLNEQTFTRLQVIKPDVIKDRGCTGLNCFGKKVVKKDKLFSPGFGNNAPQLFWKVTKPSGPPTAATETREHPITFKKVTPAASDPAACCFPRRNKKVSVSAAYLEKNTGYFPNMFARKQNVKYAINGLKLDEQLELYAVDRKPDILPEDEDQRAMTLS